MSLSIDHIIISVNDVTAAIETYRGLGFTTFFGGQHASGLTHNGLVVFHDGSYLELLSLVDPDKPDTDGFHDLIREDEGFTGFALLSDAIEKDIARMQEAGIQASNIQEGSRARPDGEILRWKGASLDDARIPFVIEDVTPRILRVPAEGDNVQHENGAQGIADVRILVADLEAGAARYQGIVGSAPVMHSETALFALAGGTLTLAQPRTDSERAYIEQYGSVPFQITLLGMGDPIAPQDAHGARFVFAG